MAAILPRGRARGLSPLIAAFFVLILAVLTWLSIARSSFPGFGAEDSKSVLDIAILVFREGLECVLVLAAITASMRGSDGGYQLPVAVGATVGFLATLLTWYVAVGVLRNLSERVSGLAVQAGTGLLAVLVLLLVMNWFFHGVYWTGWISLHNDRKRQLLQSAGNRNHSIRVWWGMALVGFTSFYREGFEVVLFLQSYRLRVGVRDVLSGVLWGSGLAGVVAILTFVAHRRLPYRKMLVVTGALLAFVLLVMVGEQAQEMQLAQWLPTTRLPVLEPVIPTWAGTWLSVFPTAETLFAQAVAGALVLGSYFVATRSARSEQSI